MSSSQENTAGTVGDDHISVLPDDILSFILSFLSIRDAVKTRLLSHRWRRLCLSASNLNFDLLSVLGINSNKVWPGKKIFLKNKSKFLMGVNQFLQSYTMPKIDTFQVTFPLGSESASHVDEWISFALGIETKRISLNFSFLSDNLDYYNFPCHLLPHGETSCLEYLELKYCVLAPSPEYAKRLNSLTTLQLCDTSINQFHLDNILSSCLNLKCLTFHECSLPKTFRIFGPFRRLESLIIYDCDDLMNIELNTLEKLYVFEYIGIVRKFKFIDVFALRKVYFRFHNNRCGNGTNFVFNVLAKDLPNLERLSVVLYPFQGLPTIERMTTTFQHLKQLDLCIYISIKFDHLSIVHILNASPALQKFHLFLIYGSGWDSTTGRKLNSKHQHLNLEEVEISGFSDLPKEMELLTYFLNNCMALKLMIVNSQQKQYRGAGCWLDFTQGWGDLNCELIRNMLLQQKVDPNVEIIVL